MHLGRTGAERRCSVFGRHVHVWLVEWFQLVPRRWRVFFGWHQINRDCSCHVQSVMRWLTLFSTVISLVLFIFCSLIFLLYFWIVMQAVLRFVQLLCWREAFQPLLTRTIINVTMNIKSQSNSLCKLFQFNSSLHIRPELLKLFPLWRWKAEL